ncbi:MAG: hypothetical protein AABW49_04865 [Nanoarchaeota archaeon]
MTTTLQRYTNRRIMNFFTDNFLEHVKDGIILELICVSSSNLLLRDRSIQIDLCNPAKHDLSQLAWIKSESVSGVWAEYLSHLTRGDLSKVLKRVYDILDKEGVLGINLPMGLGSSSQLAPYHSDGLLFTAHYNPCGLDQMIREAGFDFIQKTTTTGIDSCGKPIQSIDNLYIKH